MLFEVTFTQVCDTAVISFVPKMNSFTYDMREGVPLEVEMPIYLTDPPGCEKLVTVALISIDKAGNQIKQPDFVKYKPETRLMTVSGRNSTNANKQFWFLSDAKNGETSHNREYIFLIETLLDNQPPEFSVQLK